jgi:hypothetical protein
MPGWIGSEDSERSMFGSMDYKGLQGVMCKTASSSSTSARSRDKVDGGPAGQNQWRPGSLEVRLKCKTKGGGRGEF